jgi:hypothetical protein
MTARLWLFRLCPVRAGPKVTRLGDDLSSFERMTFVNGMVTGRWGPPTAPYGGLIGPHDDTVTGARGASHGLTPTDSYKGET